MDFNLAETKANIEQVCLKSKDVLFHDIISPSAANALAYVFRSACFPALLLCHLQTSSSEVRSKSQVYGASQHRCILPPQYLHFSFQAIAKVLHDLIAPLNFYYFQLNGESLFTLFHLLSIFLSGTGLKRDYERFDLALSLFWSPSVWTHEARSYDI